MISAVRGLLPLPFLLALLFATGGCGRAENGNAVGGGLLEPAGSRTGEYVPDPTSGAGCEVSLTVVMDNHPFREGLETSWGFSCLVEGCEKTVLFDTGGDGDILLRNLCRLGIDPACIDAVVISHDHTDHTGGLARLLEAYPDLEIYIPASSGAGLKGTARSRGGAVFEVSGARAICDGISTTGEVGSGIKEQALVVESCAGTLLITGCAHPGIAEMVRAARSTVTGTVVLAMGGFHLGSSSAAVMERIIAELKALGVRRVGPCHCTGERAIQAFAAAFGDGFLRVGAGKRVDARELE